MRQIREYCGIFGIFNSPDAAHKIYLGLHALQHRGQESAGIVTSVFDEAKGKKVMPSHKDHGLVLDVFKDTSIFETKLLGSSGIGHNRYSTSGASDNPANIQPFLVHYRDGNLALAHNGNISNAREIRRSFIERGTLFQSTADSEMILHLIAQSTRRRQIDKIIDAVSQLEGAFSLVMLTDDSLIALRDPNGFKPLALGRITDEEGNDTYCVSSETCAFDLAGAVYIRDIEPGELIVINQKGVAEGKFESYNLAQNNGVSQCVFEYVYFSRPDSKIFGEMVDKVRRKMGKELAHDAPVPIVPEGEAKPIVISVPDSSNTATLGYVTECRKLGYRARYEIGLIRNHYVGRTFIAPGQQAREQRVRSKFNTVEGVLKGRVVVMVDDSIVRGTTARQLVQMVRNAGAKEVHFRVASPPVSHPCFYGMDFPSHEELFANQYDGDVDEMAKWLGVDSLAYLTIDGLKRAVLAANDNPHGYCNACFSGNYPVEVDMSVSKDENEW
ncbi:MAG: amidophosphoribosyltransferase [Bacteroidetes Order II. Incertae sedis bacterium]|jgi:amidophosphoribosyltransferase|nr:amidophosphoribosyltransferase [Bacteroidetes Order II. bacterium]MBT4052056.1 amidophosphoribosyltransferase [Bacteroidetes Order II. bacterium]MBT4601727.1 amidophosphoribosyltransferase [Bacteroidetes Order II. bacterium]MBT5249332.1 amidophosphoribosyltransferase [Bacteroidetes Order II. bacterium]MBT6199992.1 amidophosphoribosyltransferase [Bacteroidetes Order II. bacterium]